MVHNKVTLVLIALVACALVAGWQALTVQFNFNGQWNALFYTAESAELPESLAEDVARAREPAGYAFSFWLAARRNSGVIESCLGVFALGAVWLGKADIWAGAYEFGRTLSPLLVLLGLEALSSRRYRYLLPLLFVLPRIALQFQPQVLGVLRGMTR